ncbi:MAG: ribosome maturation factor RimM [Pseudomonadota bacterium]
MNTRDPEEKNDEVVLGYVSGVHGLKGWVKVFSYTDPRDAILDYRPWRMGREGEASQVVNLERGQPHGKTIIAALPGVTTPEAARALVGDEIRYPRDEMPESGQGSWYWSDLLGLAVINREGVQLGTVRQMIETGANDVMVLAGERERLIPFVMEQVVQAVDLAAREIRVDWHPDD